MNKFLLFFLMILVFIFNPISVYSLDQDAILAGGCFWCLEHDLEKLDGVSEVVSGYSGGELKNPTYQNHQGHQESVKVTFDPDVISYKKLLNVYFSNIDPFDNEGQFCDKGDSYRAVIFTDENQKDVAREVRKKASLSLGVSEDNLKVSIKPKSVFWKAEDYHQDFADKNEFRYKIYRYSCGRDQRLKDVWGEKAGISIELAK